MSEECAGTMQDAIFSPISSLFPLVCWIGVDGRKCACRSTPSLDGSGGFQLFVRCLTRRSIIVHVHPHDTIYHLKSVVYDKCGLPHLHRRFIFSGKQLEDSK